MPVGRARRAHLSAVPLDDRLHDPEPQAEAARVRLLVGRAVEALEDRRTLEFGRAGAGILDPELDPVLAPFGADGDFAVLGAELARVREQVRDDLREPLHVARDDRDVVRDLDPDSLAALVEEPRDEVLGILDDLGERDRLAADAELARLDADALEEVVDQAREPERAALQRLEELAEPLARH